MRRWWVALLGVSLAAPLVLAPPSRAVEAGSAPGLPTPFVTAPTDLGPLAAEHPAAGSCLGQNSALTAPVGDRTFVALNCGTNSSRVLVSLLESDGTRVEPWALIAGSNSGRVFVRDVAVDATTGDIGVVLGLPGGPQTGLGLAKYTAATSSWTTITPESMDAGVQAPCVDPSFTADLELGSLMAGGTLTVIAPYSREVDLPDPPFGRTGEVSILRSTWSGTGCAPGFGSFPIATGGDLLPGAADPDVVDLEVSQVPSAATAVVAVNYANGSATSSDDTYDVLLVDPFDGTVTPLLGATAGRVKAIDLVEDAAGSSALISTHAVGPPAVRTVPLDGSAGAVVAGAQYAMSFVDRERPYDDPGAIPIGLDRWTTVGRTAAMLYDAAAVSYLGAQNLLPPYDQPRTPEARVAWREADQPGGVRVVPLPASSIDDPVHWRIPDTTAVRVVVRDGTPVLTGPCGLDTSARLWQCVSTWDAESGWRAPEAVRQAVVPSWPVSGGADPVLVASMTDASLRLVVRDGSAPSTNLGATGSTTVAPGTAVSGTLVATDDNDGPEIACRVMLGATELAVSTIPPHDDNQYFPGAAIGETTLAWTTPTLAPGEYDVRAWCIDRAGNRSADQVLKLDVSLEAPSAPVSVLARPHSASAVVSWLEPAAEAVRAIPSSYVVEVKDPRTSTVRDGCATTSRWCRVTGLENGILYQVRALSMSAVGAGGASAWVSVRPIGVPSRVAGLTVVWRSGGRAQVYWKPSSSPSAPVQGYRVLVNGRLKGIARSSSASSLIIDGQRAGSTYTFAVEAFNAMGRATSTLPPRLRTLP